MKPLTQKLIATGVGVTVLLGSVAYLIYDEVATRNRWAVDEAGYEQAMAKLGDVKLVYPPDEWEKILGKPHVVIPGPNGSRNWWGSRFEESGGSGYVPSAFVGGPSFKGSFLGLHLGDPRENVQASLQPQPARFGDSYVDNEGDEKRKYWLGEEPCWIIVTVELKDGRVKSIQAFGPSTVIINR